MKKRAQEAIEYVTIFGFVAVIIAIVVILFSQYSGTTSDDIITENIEAIGKAIVNEAHRLFYTGEGSSNTMKVSLPQNVLSITTNGKELIFNVALSKTTTDIVIPSEAPLQVSITNIAGLKELELKYEDGVIKIIEA